MRAPTAADTDEMELSPAELELVIYAIDIAQWHNDRERRDRAAALRQRFAVELSDRLSLKGWLKTVASAKNPAESPPRQNEKR